MSGKKSIYKCKTCGDPFSAREADRKRGWARFCSKSCKAIKQEQKTGQFTTYLSDKYDSGEIRMSIADLNSCQD